VITEVLGNARPFPGLLLKIVLPSPRVCALFSMWLVDGAVEVQLEPRLSKEKALANQVPMYKKR
jgi:hypothetical protein